MTVIYFSQSFMCAQPHVVCVCVRTYCLFGNRKACVSLPVIHRCHTAEQSRHLHAALAHGTPTHHSLHCHCQPLRRCLSQTKRDVSHAFHAFLADAFASHHQTAECQCTCCKQGKTPLSYPASCCRLSSSRYCARRPSPTASGSTPSRRTFRTGLIRASGGSTLACAANVTRHRNTAFPCEPPTLATCEILNTISNREGKRALASPFPHIFLYFQTLGALERALFTTLLHAKQLGGSVRLEAVCAALAARFLLEPLPRPARSLAQVRVFRKKVQHVCSQLRCDCSALRGGVRGGVCECDTCCWRCVRLGARAAARSRMQACLLTLGSWAFCNRLD